jgi:MoaA/NifB/PqqE/SkfB family radical SAM enzyme
MSPIPAPLKFFLHQVVGFFGRDTYYWPLCVIFSLTYRCNLSCSYCDSGKGQRCADQRYDEISLEQWEIIMDKMVSHSPILVITGGEPLLYPAIPDLLRSARRKGFSFISLNTNGLLLTEEIIGLVDAVIVSLDSLNQEKSDRLWGKPGATEQVLRLIDRMAGKPHPTLMINSVILPETIPDVEQLLEFCLARGITFSAGPALHQNRPFDGLKHNPRYRRLLQKILAAKKSGGRIAATVDYLRAAKWFRPYHCHPQLVWRVLPDGTLSFPCIRQNRGAGSLLGNETPISLFHRLEGSPFLTQDCPENCPLSCFMDTSFMTQRPLSLIREGLFRLRSFAPGHRTVF